MGTVREVGGSGRAVWEAVSVWESVYEVVEIMERLWGSVGSHGKGVENPCGRLWRGCGGCGGSVQGAIAAMQRMWVAVLNLGRCLGESVREIVERRRSCGWNLCRRRWRLCGRMRRIVGRDF